MKGRKDRKGKDIRKEKGIGEKGKEQVLSKQTQTGQKSTAV